MIQCAPHPLLDAVAFETRFPVPLGQLAVSDEVRSLFSLSIEAPVTAGSNVININAALTQSLMADFKATTPDAAALMSAEVINLQCSLIFTGDDFRHVDCDASLDVAANRHRACVCEGSRTRCTLGLHTVLGNGGGTARIQNARVEKCGQRGLLGVRKRRKFACSNLAAS